jgi:hypothetical protein
MSLSTKAFGPFAAAITRPVPSRAIRITQADGTVVVFDAVERMTAIRAHIVLPPISTKEILLRAIAEASLQRDPSTVTADGLGLRFWSWALMSLVTLNASIHSVFTKTDDTSSDGVRLSGQLQSAVGFDGMQALVDMFPDGSVGVGNGTAVPVAAANSISVQLYLNVVPNSNTAHYTAFNNAVQQLRAAGRGATVTVAVPLMPVGAWEDKYAKKLCLRAYAHPDVCPIALSAIVGGAVAPAAPAAPAQFSMF